MIDAIQLTSGNNIAEIIQLVYEGAVVNHTALSQQTPLHIASTKGINNSKVLVQLLLNCKANHKAIEGNNWTPIHYAIVMGNHEAMDVYLERNLVDQEDLNFAKNHNKGDMVTRIEKSLENRKQPSLL